MNEKDIGFLRRRFKADGNNITSIRGCYVNTKHEIISSFKQNVGMLPAEEYEKYVGIFKKVLSGSLGKTLSEVSFGTNSVLYSRPHKLLTDIRSSALSDDAACDEFFSTVINTLPTDDNYLVLLMSDAVDLPAEKGEDSGEMFTYIVCCACPVHNSKPSLSYSDEDKVFHASRLIRQISMPEVGFVFPAFENRKANIYGALCYSRDGEGRFNDFVKGAFDTELPMSAKDQKSTFCRVLEKSIGDSLGLDVVQNIGDRLSDMIEEHKQNKDEVLSFSKHFVASALENSGIESEKIENFENMFDEQFGKGAEIHPVSIVGSGRTVVKTPDVVINVAKGKSDLIQTRVIDGMKYILVRANDSVEVNGVNIEIKEDV